MEVARDALRDAASQESSAELQRVLLPEPLVDELPGASRAPGLNRMPANLTPVPSPAPVDHEAQTVAAWREVAVGYRRALEVLPVEPIPTARGSEPAALGTLRSSGAFRSSGATGPAARVAGMPGGIDTRHQRSCRSLVGGRCNCKPTLSGERVEATARGRADPQDVRERGGGPGVACPDSRRPRSAPGHDARPPSAAYDAARRRRRGWRARRMAPIRNRSGDRYKPSRGPRLRDVAATPPPAPGARRPRSSRRFNRADVQDFVDRLAPRLES